MIFPFRKRVTAANVDEKSKFIAVGNCVGEVKVLTFASGGKIKDYKWEQLRPWFRAHDIGRMESTYVN